MMLSRREFIGITSAMGALVFLFQGLGYFRAAWTRCNSNPRAVKREQLPGKSSAFSAGAKTPRAPVACIGLCSHGSAAKAAKDWAYYQKRECLCYSTVNDFGTALSGLTTLPQLVVVDAAAIGREEQKALEILEQAVHRGIALAFAGIPEGAVRQSGARWRALLGIRAVRQSRVSAKGLHLYAGLLLGGEALYLPEEKAGSGCPELQNGIPWFSLLSGTKVYMKAVPEAPEVDVQEQPPVLWRYGGQNAMVFVAGGDMLQGCTGLGLLSAFLYEMQDAVVYPVVNAQSFVAANFPVFTEENDAIIRQNYGRSLAGFQQDILWPAIGTIAAKKQFGVTCMAAPRLDYGSSAQPQVQRLNDALQLANEQQFELGLSGFTQDGSTLCAKLKADAAFWQKAGCGYSVSSFYTGGAVQKTLHEALVQDDFMAAVRTVVHRADADSALLGYETEAVTFQKGVVGAVTHTCREDLAMRSAETALGYTGIVADFACVFYPQSRQDLWEKLSDAVLANTDTYWKPFRMFAPATASETDDRIRRFLALDYAVQQAGQTLTITVERTEGPVWFIVRRHHGQLQSVEGGSAVKIETGAWLLCAEKPQLLLTFAPDEKAFYAAQEAKP